MKEHLDVLTRRGASGPPMLTTVYSDLESESPTHYLATADLIRVVPDIPSSEGLLSAYRAMDDGVEAEDGEADVEARDEGENGALLAQLG